MSPPPPCGRRWGPAPLASDGEWTRSAGLGPVAGRATAVAIDTADASGNTVYVGGAYGGVWKSTNAVTISPNPLSVTWTAVTDDQPTLAVGAIAIQPQQANPDATRSVILVGTGETNNSSDSYYGLGILRSDNAGNTWTLISQDNTGNRSFAGLGFSKIAFSTANPSLVVAAAAGATQGVVEGRGSGQRKSRALLLQRRRTVVELRDCERCRLGH